MTEETDRPEHDDELCPTLAKPCFQCHLHGLTLGKPSDFPTRTRSKGKPRGSMNSYENGIPTSKRPGGTEMPFLRADGEVMRMKEFERKRHQIEKNTERAKTVPLSTTI